MTEQIMVESFIEYLKSQNLHDYATEVAVFGNSSIIDLVHIDKRRRMVCIEFKLGNIKKVFKQAIKLRRHTPLVYVAIPLPYRKPHIRVKDYESRFIINELAKNAIIEKAEENDLGVWFLTPEPDSYWQTGIEPAIHREAKWDEKFNFIDMSAKIEDMFYRHLNGIFLYGIRDFYKDGAKPFIFPEFKELENGS